MFIERFFNPVIVSSDPPVFYNKKEALIHCSKYFTRIRHFSFKGTEYIKNNGKCLVWNDGSKVNRKTLPAGPYGRYFNEIYNFESF